MKFRLTLLSALVIVVVLSFACNPPPATETKWKATGGGWGSYEDGAKVTFGFNAQPTGNGSAKGEFQLQDRSITPPLNIHGRFDATGQVLASDENRTAKYSGTCSVNGEDSYNFEAAVQDNGEPGFGTGDAAYVKVTDGEGAVVYEAGGVIQGGNIQVHSK